MDREDKPAPTGREPEAEAEEQPVSESVSGFGVNAALVEEIRQRYEVDPSSVHASWAEFFEKPETATPVAPPPELEPAPAEPPRVEMAAQVADKHARVLRLIHSYRARGHRIADTDPLGGAVLVLPGAGSGPLRLRQRRSRPALHRRRSPGRLGADAAPDPRAAARDLLPQGRRRVHPRPGPRAQGLAATPARGHLEHDAVLDGRAPARARVRRGGGALRALPAHQVRGAEALLAGGRGVADPAARHDRRGRSRPWRLARSCSAWRTAGASTCSRTPCASRSSRSSPSSKTIR